MEELNVLIVENSTDAITKAKRAFRHSFNELNKRAKLNVNINIFPEDDKEKGFSDKLVEYVNNSKKFSNYNLVSNYIKEQFDVLKINVLLLDFLLSRDEETTHGDNHERIDNSSGAKILKLIRESKYKNIPCIGYTQLKDQVPQLQTHSSGTLFQIDKILMEENYFIENQGYLYNMLIEAEKYQNEIENQCDIVVVCALKKEIKPVIRLLKFEKHEDEKDTSAIGYITKDNVKLKVKAISREQMGIAEAATLTTQMIEKHNPLYVVMTGIAGGIDEKGQKFLDILMPSRIYNWQSGKYKVKIDEKEEKEKILHVFDRDYSSVGTYIEENSTLNIDEKYLKNLPEEFLRTEAFEGEFGEDNIRNYIKKVSNIRKKDRSEFQKEIIELHVSEPNSVVNILSNMANSLDCEIHKDAMVSGSAVVADGHIVDTHIKQRKVDGIDMEAYGVVYACNHNKKKPKAIILKAICDFADDKKNDIYQSAAAYVSAHAFYNLFTENIDMKSKS